MKTDKKYKHRWIDGIWCIKKIKEYHDRYGNIHPAQYLMDRKKFNINLNNNSIEFNYKITFKDNTTEK